MRNKAAFLCLLVLIAAVAGLLRLVARQNSKQNPAQTTTVVADPFKTEAPNTAPAAPAEPVADIVGQLRLADDAEQKAADFWLEQIFELSETQTNNLQRPDEVITLYAGYDAKTQRGIRLRLNAESARLEEVSGNDAKVLAESKASAWAPREYILGALKKGSRLSFWLNEKELCAIDLSPEQLALLRQPSGTQAHLKDMTLGARRTEDQRAILFTDAFMRTTQDGNWKPLFGRWELTQLAFPERSANPFSLRVGFGTETVNDDRLFQGRIRERDNEYGIGVMISPYEGTLHIERITGGSPAARAGLAENDIFLEVDGIPIHQLHGYQVMQMLHRGFRDKVRLKMLRPGEKIPREFVITKDFYRWGTPVETLPLSPNNDPGASGNDRFALIFSGDAGWSNYSAEVAMKPLGAGGAGLIVAALSNDDYLLFRWRGPIERGTETPTAADRLELVRVKNGAETILASREGSYRPYEFYRMGVDWKDEQILCYIDGNEIFNQKVPGLQRGRVGLYALKGDPVFFDDIRVASDRAVFNSQPGVTSTKINAIFASELQMSSWGNPALEWKRNLVTGWAVHEGRFPNTQFMVLNEPKFDELEIAFLCSDDPTDAKATVRISGNRIRSHGPKWDIDEEIPPGPYKQIKFVVMQRAIEIDLDGKIITSRNPNLKKERDLTIAQQRLAIKGLKNLGKPDAVRVSAENLLEYAFDSAPVDWKVESGRWGLLNKWICDPRWSWFGGRTRTVAALWNKYIFRGDQSVDAHVALMMQREEPPFERPGDYNITLCGDGVNLDSGYTLIFAGDGNSWTRLYRKGVLVAESTEEAHRLFSDRIRHPDKPDLHQRWFHLRLEKSGNDVSFYRDGVKAFTFTDPEPLSGGRTAFWTLDNGFLLSRVRIAHSGAKPAPFEPRRAKAYEDARLINQYDGEVLTSVTPQNLPAAIKTSLKSPADAFAPATADALSEKEALAPMPATGGSAEAWRVENAIGGGPFCAQIKGALIDPEARGILRFAYRIEPGAKIDLYLVDVSDRGGNPRYTGAYRWRMSGPKESTEFAALAGDVPNVVADGKWHTVQVDLQPGWRKMWKERGYFRVNRPALRLMFGNIDNSGYLLAGMNGNHAGAAYSVSDIIAFSPSDIDKTPPKIARVIWPFDTDGDGRSIQIVTDDGNGSGVVEESLQITLNETAVPREYLGYNDFTRIVSIDLARVGVARLVAQPDLNIKLMGFQDRAGNKQGPFEAQWKFTPEAAKAWSAAKKGAFPAPYIAAEITGDASTVPTNSALSLYNLQPLAPVARLQESTDAPPWAPEGDRRSIQITNVMDASAFGFALEDGMYNLRNWPYMLIDYKIPFETPTNLHFTDQYGSIFALLLTDVGDGVDPESREIQGRFGPPPDFKADGTWRRSIIPLQKMFMESTSYGPGTTLRSVSLNDSGWRGNRRGMEYHIHKLQPLPAARAEAIRFKWMARDLCGSDAYAASIDGKPETDPADRKEIISGELLSEAIARNALKLTDGWNYLHVKTRNAAGLWSAVSHQPFFLDRVPPKVSVAASHTNNVITGQTIQLQFDDPSGIDSSSLKIALNGRAIGAGWRGVNFDRATGLLTIDASRAGMSFNDQQAVQVSALNVRDLLGNVLEKSETFNLTVNHGADKQPPEISQLRLVSSVLGQNLHRQMQMETSFGLDFEEHTGHLQALRDAKLEWLRDGGLFAKGSMKIIALDNDGDLEVLLHQNAWWADHAPLLQFDYIASPGFVADLKIEVLGDWYTVRFLGASNKAIGRVEDAAADGKVRHASVDLRSLLENAIPNWSPRLIEKIILSTNGQPGLKRGATLLIDNMDLTSASGTGRFEWKATDPSGILGYSVLFDQEASTVPPEAVNTSNPVMAAGGRMGVWYLHVRACDQAGNWGPTRHIRVDFGEEK